MLILRGLHSLDHQPLALTIGNFDGVHLGHQALLQQLRQAAQARGLETAVMVFEPHPREFFTPQQAPTRLTSLREKTEMFGALGLDRMLVCSFTQEFAQMPATDFIHALHEKLAAKYVLIGDDFRFGSGRAGDFALMEKIGQQHGFEVEAMHSVRDDGVRVSSTAVREALAQGRLHAAERFLGRAYSISGHVEHGNKMGRQLGFPTANIQLQHNRPPLSGIFVVRVRIEGGERDARPRDAGAFQRTVSETHRSPDRLRRKVLAHFLDGNVARGARSPEIAHHIDLAKGIRVAEEMGKEVVLALVGAARHLHRRLIERGEAESLYLFFIEKINPCLKHGEACGSALHAQFADFEILGGVEVLQVEDGCARAPIRIGHPCDNLVGEADARASHAQFEHAGIADENRFAESVEEVRCAEFRDQFRTYARSISKQYANGWYI